jgi:hypothetical protein
MLVLIMSCKSSSAFGSVVWKSNPTVCALIKMIVSNRYRFPTVDCDDAARESLKRDEQTARDMVRTHRLDHMYFCVVVALTYPLSYLVTGVHNG